MTEYYITQDLGLAAALVARGFPLVRIEAISERSVQFLFDDDEKIREAEEKYFSGKLRVPAREYSSQMRTLKSRIAQTLHSEQPRASSIPLRQPYEHYLRPLA